jgi:hypothetical protein
MDKANGTHCVAQNAPLLEEVVALRHGTSSGSALFVVC